ncbi:hypothetical protein [Cerasicoccus frondis]|uniref:hypothetical protein n=1 Tax=Cerasicoccus frondis TaxID=490090 RepID=UPI002852C885|nr:hypothetical protein [Cerasicoccus frondis]
MNVLLAGMHSSRISIFALITLLAVTSASAGIVGWLTEERADWDFIQKTGGVRVESVAPTEGGWLLTIRYDVTGLTKVTREPEQMNSGMMVHRVTAKPTVSDYIDLEIRTSAIEAGASPSTLHTCKLPQLRSGHYRVYYGDPKLQQLVGTITIPEPSE